MEKVQRERNAEITARRQEESTDTVIFSRLEIGIQVQKQLEKAITEEKIFFYEKERLYMKFKYN